MPPCVCRRTGHGFFIKSRKVFDYFPSYKVKGSRSAGRRYRVDETGDPGIRGTCRVFCRPFDGLGNLLAMEDTEEIAPYFG